MTVGAPKGKTVAEPAPTKRDAVPWGAGAPGGFPGALRTPSATEDSAQGTSITRLATWASGEDRLSLSVTE